MLPLKEAIAEKHKIAERMPFNSKMIKGELSKNEYLTYLIQLKEIHSAIETHSLPHPSLNRLEKLELDIQELEDQQAKSGSILKSTKKYSDYLKGLTFEQCLPHVYMHYLAIAYGGQMIRKAVPSTGKYYDFENLHEAVGSIRAVQENEWADEVNLGFDYIIEIFRELDAQTLTSKLL